MNIRSNAFFFLALALSAACSSSTDDTEPTSSTSAAVTTFFDDFHASRYSVASRDAKALDDAFTASPNDGQIAFVRGLAHNWHLAEAARDPSPDGATLQAEGMASLDQFTTAKKLNAADTRVDCFLGLAQVNTGRAAKSDALVSQGLATLDAAVTEWPEFNWFCKALAYDDLPATDPDYEKTVDALYSNLDACFGETVDRDNPDITKYLGQATDTGNKRACWNDTIAPHNAEGFYLYAGDALVKAGKIAPAKVMYGNAKLVREYASWPYKSILEARLSSDLDARAALYQDSDPSNDPKVGGAADQHSCTQCHAASAAE